MNASLRARSATGIAALLLAGLLVGVLAGCNEQERRPATVVATLVESSPYPGAPVGSAAAKGAELSAVATVQAWIDARNRSVRTGSATAVDDLTGPGCDACDSYLDGGRWVVVGARVTRHTVRTATVRASIEDTRRRARVALEFEVGRVAGQSAITEIRRVP
ncbi:hypothetical protein [Nocardioides pelophilus]|uniref:hypothetical protein n=1 Tax=Nocardioides pelophilus TaxID=2172019 RepID=UPI0016022851|nr:hypothetical protein [Nocardioides pelophilus]